jgi:nitrite reductase/ring-hydroxylating ferredoxin subunit
MDGIRDIHPSDMTRPLGRFMRASPGRHEFFTDCEPRDMDWNHMDKLHRPHVHRTYARSVPLVRGPDADLTLNRYFGPFFILVGDYRIGPGHFFQAYTVLGLFYVHTDCRFEAAGEGRSRVTIQWQVGSHALLRPLHPLLHAWLRRLNRKQHLEDEPVRLRRAALRARGYSFATDAPDFADSNVVADHVRYPRLAKPFRVAAAALPAGEIRKVSSEGVDVLVRREPDGAVTVWNAVCPHEGGPLEAGAASNGHIRCPWHGVSCKGARLSPSAPSAELPGLRVRWAGDGVTVESL